MSKFEKKIGRNDPCPCGSGKKYKKCCQRIQKPPQGTFQKVFDFGSNDPFAARMMFQMFQLRDQILIGTDRDIFDKLYDTVLQNLTEAKIVKEKCIKLLERHKNNIKNGKVAKFDGQKIDVKECIDTDLNIWFKDFFIRGNMASKGLIKLAQFFNFKISFMFGNDVKFKKGEKKFLDGPRKDIRKFILDLMKDHRKKWYKSFVKLRSKIEHEGFRVPDIKYGILDGEVHPIIPKFDKMEIEEFLELLWDNLFVLCEDIVVLPLSTKLKKPFVIMSLPENQRNKEMPVRYILTTSPPKNAKKIEYKDLAKH